MWPIADNRIQIKIRSVLIIAVIFLLSLQFKGKACRPAIQPDMQIAICNTVTYSANESMNRLNKKAIVKRKRVYESTDCEDINTLHFKAGSQLKVADHDQP